MLAQAGRRLAPVYRNLHDKLPCSSTGMKQVSDGAALLQYHTRCEKTTQKGAELSRAIRLDAVINCPSQSSTA